MKKLVLIIILTCTTSLSFAQNRGMFYIQESNTVGSFEEDWGCNISEVSFSYLWDIGKILHLGAGIGIGISNPVKYYSNWKIDEEKNQSAFTMPLYGKFKVDFNSNPTHVYFATKIGTRIASVEGFDGKKFNPFSANITPAIGVNINIGGGNNIFIETGLDANFSKYQQIEYAYNNILKKYIYDGFENKTDGAWAGFYFSIGFGF